jgi:hypothetical protein
MENICQPDSQVASLILEDMKEMCDAMRRPYGQQPLQNGGVPCVLVSEKCTSSSLHSPPANQYEQCKISYDQGHHTFPDGNSPNHPTQTSSPSNSFQAGIYCPDSPSMCNLQETPLEMPHNGPQVSASIPSSPIKEMMPIILGSCTMDTHPSQTSTSPPLSPQCSY